MCYDISSFRARIQVCYPLKDMFSFLKRGRKGRGRWGTGLLLEERAVVFRRRRGNIGIRRGN